MKNEKFNINHHSFENVFFNFYIEFSRHDSISAGSFFWIDRKGDDAFYTVKCGSKLSSDSLFLW